MTYRSTMGGLGDTPQLTGDQVATYLRAFAASGGCSPSTQANMKALSCLNGQYVQILGNCLVGVTPPGLNDLEYAGACMGLAKCGLYDKPGCPADAAQYVRSIPQCLNDDVRPLVDYCRATPNFQGPNRQGNAACWAMSRYPDLFHQVMNLPACGPPAAPQPPPSVAPPVYQAPPPPAYQPPPQVAPPVYQDAPPPPVTASESTPSTLPTGPADMGPADASLPASAPQESNMMMWGLAGAAVLGLGYLMFRKKG